MSSVIGRLAPSPTGAQHVGNARTYLIAWLSVRTRGGKVLLRVEDIDSPRIKHRAAQEALADLAWLGLDWDGEPVFQTQRLDLYQSALKTLQEQELVYPCTCSRNDVERAASAPHADHEGPVYPGTCSGRRVADAALLENQPHSWRIRVGEGSWEFTDGLWGPVRHDLRQTAGDFVVWKSATTPSTGDVKGTPAYQLAVVVDDAAQKVTEVLRGDDLIPSTPRQLLLYRTLGLNPPRFVHVPLVVGPDGRRLAKRHGDTRLSALRKAGVSSQDLLGLLAWSCAWIDRIKPISLSELLPLFRLDSIPKKPFVLQPELLEKIGY